MELICKCGGKVKEARHDVASVRGAMIWGVDCKLPATVEQSECKSCGRYAVRVTDAHGVEVLRRG